MKIGKMILRGLLFTLFWLCVVVWFCVSSGCTRGHQPECLCTTCEAQYYAERDHAERLTNAYNGPEIKEIIREDDPVRQAELIADFERKLDELEGAQR
jgi:hypothetical protein